MNRVLIESPYAGDTEANTRYARDAMLDSLNRGEAPYLSHLLYTQVLDDRQPAERTRGMEAGLAWGKAAHIRAFYVDRGMSAGMIEGLRDAISDRQLVVFRSLAGMTEAVVVNMEGGPYTVPLNEEWQPPDPADSLDKYLRMVSHPVPVETIALWTREQREDAALWARHFLDTGGQPTEPKPEHMHGYHQQPLPIEPPSVRALRDWASPRVTHYYAMGGKETACGIRARKGIQGTYRKGDTDCPACSDIINNKARA